MATQMATVPTRAQATLIQGTVSRPLDPELNRYRSLWHFAGRTGAQQSHARTSTTFTHSGPG